MTTVCLLNARERSQFAHITAFFFKIILHSLGVGPSTKQLRKFFFKPLKSHDYIFTYYTFHILEFSGMISFPLNFLDKPKISRNFPNFGKSGNTDLAYLKHCVWMRKLSVGRVRKLDRRSCWGSPGHILIFSPCLIPSFLSMLIVA